MSPAVVRVALRLRLPGAVSTGIGLVAVMAAVGALFPAIGHTIGQLHVPQSVVNLLGGADYGTVTGWFRSEIAVIYAPLVTGALAITGSAALIGGEEEAGILGLMLAYPLSRSRLLLSKAAAIAVVVVVLAVSIWVGLIVGVALAGGGIALAHITALTVQLTFFGFAIGALAMAVAGGTGSRSLASGVAAAVAILGWLINSFAPLVGGLGWMKYLSLFYYYAGRDPLGRGVDLGGIAVLAAVATGLTAAAVTLFQRRDLRG